MAKKQTKTIKAQKKLFTWKAWLFILIFSVVGGLVLWKTFATSTGSITVSNPNPVYGDKVTLTAVYPSAARKKIGRQQMVQPQIDLDCYQTSSSGTSTVYYQVRSPATEVNLGNGWWQGTTLQFTLGGNTSVGDRQYSWPSGPATCDGFVGYFVGKDLVWTSVASVNFNVQ
jgi:hypothetical protein